MDSHIKKTSDFFQLLTPQVIEENEKIVENLQALNYAIEEASIKNIALTGSYGSGKSSILKTLEDRHKEHRYLRISLASFNDPEFSKESNTAKLMSEESRPKPVEQKKTDSSKEDQTQENLERLLELSILQQIFYHVDHDKIPDSRFKRIISLGADTILNFQIASIIWILSAWYLFFPNSLRFETISFFNADILKLFALILFFVGLAKLLSHFRRVYNNSKVNKFNIQSGEVEIDQEVDQSILNKHIDEIIYFFEVTPYNVVMIEDLDRFNNTAIFSKLREINLLINNSEQINRTINFIYAVRDDIFKDSHRTKFFDFFIPVIPVSDPSNATDILTRNFKKLDRNVPNEDFLSDVASFIPDMRFLNNVFNEYLLYESNIKANLSPEKRLAIILYKNLYPEDFISLQQGKGMLYEVLRSRNKLVKVITKDINEEIIETKNKLSALKEDLLLQEKELRSIYINAIQNSVGNSVGIKIEEIFRGFASLSNEEMFNKIPKEEPIIHQCMDGPNRNHSHFRQTNGKSLSEIETSVNPKLSYEERLNQIRHKATENKYLQELTTQKKELSRLRHLNLGQLLSKTIDHKNFGDFEKDELVIYLLKNGNIDENYISYISHFYEGQITVTDYEFYQNVISGTTNTFDFQLMKTSNLIQKMAPRFFLREPVLNLNLADQLIKNQRKFEAKYELFYQQVSNQSELSKDFILYYAEHGQYSGKFLAEVYQAWPLVWEFLAKKVDLEKKQRNYYLLLLLQEVDTEKLLETIPNNGIKTFIIEDAEILKLLRKVSMAKMQRLIEETPIYFSQLDYSNEKEIQSLLSYILSTGHWKFTERLAMTACRFYIDPSIAEKKVKECPFTLLSSIKELSPVINKDIHHFTEELLLEKPFLKEAPEALQRLLNNSDILLEYKEKIIQLQDPGLKIKRVKEINKSEVQEMLLKFGRVDATWVNVLDYFKEREGIDVALITFLNDYADLLILDESENSSVDTFRKQLLLCNEIELEAYKFLIPFFFKNPVSSKGFEKLSQQKMAFLIENNIIAMNPEMFSLLKDHFEGYQIRLAEKHSQKFLQKLSLLTLDSVDLNQLILSDRVKDDFKYQVISNFKETIPEMNEEASQNLATILLNKTTLGLPSSSILHLIQSANSDKEAIKFLILYEEELSEENLKKAVQKLPTRFHKVLRKRRRLELPRLEVYIDLGSLLERHHIATLKIKSKTITITGSYK